MISRGSVAVEVPAHHALRRELVVGKPAGFDQEAALDALRNVAAGPDN